MLATEVIYEAENGLLPEVDVATASNPASVVAANGTAAASPLRAQWLQAREELAAQVTAANTTYRNHPGSNEWAAYILSDLCKKMMLHLSNAYTGIDSRLAQHWNQIFTGRKAKLLMRDFRAKARVDVLLPDLKNPTKEDPLVAIVISLKAETSSFRKETFQAFSAADARFLSNGPIVFLSWDNISPWSIIVPGKGYWQLGTFWYTDENGKKWDSGEVISQGYYQNLRISMIENDFQVLGHSYARLQERGALYNELSRLQRQLTTLDKKIEAWSKVSLPESQLAELTRRAEMFTNGDPAAPRGLLLTGSSGTGKTLIGKTLANEGGLAFVAATTADVKANFLGQSGNQVKLLFQRARTLAPVILFLDELHIIAPARVGANDPLTDEIVGQLLQEMDGIQAQESQVFLLAATNHPENVDRAILSRFRDTVVIPLPDKDARRRLLSIMLEKKRLAFSPEEHLSALVARTEGMSGRDLKNYVGRAEQSALIRAMNNGGPQHFALQFQDFQQT